MGLAVSVAGVHGDVLDVALVRQEANRGTVKPSSLILGMGQQSATEAPPLLLGRDGDVLDPQLIVVQHEFDDTRERSAARRPTTPTRSGIWSRPPTANTSL